MKKLLKVVLVLLRNITIRLDKSANKRMYSELVF